RCARLAIYTVVEESSSSISRTALEDDAGVPILACIRRRSGRHPHSERRFPMVDEQNLENPNTEPSTDDEQGVEVLQARVQELEEQLAAAQDQALRNAAEMQNVRRRAEQDVEKAHKFALEKFAADLLPVVDSLGRGLELTPATDEASKAVREGLELTQKLLLDTLKRHQLEQLDPQGEPFNPEHHQAMAMEESDSLE